MGCEKKSGGLLEGVYRWHFELEDTKSIHYGMLL
jgi:hypothetical protein